MTKKNYDGTELDDIDMKKASNQTTSTTKSGKKHINKEKHRKSKPWLKKINNKKNK